MQIDEFLKFCNRCGVAFGPNPPHFLEISTDLLIDEGTSDEHVLRLKAAVCEPCKDILAHDITAKADFSGF